MTIQEFSNEFDTLLNSYNSQAAFGLEASKRELVLDEYEKSIYLTLALELIVKELYNGDKSNFEFNEEVRRLLSNLVVSHICTRKNFLSPLFDAFAHICFNLPSDCWYIVYEQAKFNVEDNPCLNSKSVEVIPSTHDEYQRLIRNPFRGPNNNKVLRLDIGNDAVEIISKYDIDSYYIRYICKPSPIILCDLEDDLKIDNESTALTCLLPESLHRVILDRAVRLALVTRTNNNTAS